MKRSLSWFCGFTVFFAIAMAFVFWGAWSTDVSFVQPDHGGAFPADYFARKWRDICGGSSFIPSDLLDLAGGPYVWQELYYAVAMYLAALGMAYYLKGRGLPPVARYGAAAAYGLMGYNLTLFSAGHFGWFGFLMCGPFCFGLIDRCVRKGKWTNWALLGGVLAWSSARQPDIWLLFAVVAFSYGVFKTVVVIRGSLPAERKRVALRIVAGVALALVSLALAGWPQLKNAIFVQTANRDKQISETTGATGKPADAGDDAEKRYVFCTNWSLPPDETLEFFWPDVNGGSSDGRVSPGNTYHGRIGIQIAPGRWQPYRQHSLYMGFITMCFAFTGMVLWLRRRKTAGCSRGGAGSNGAEMAFWVVSAVILLFCAFGAFTPFYRLVFMLPAGDYIRCPVKFVHVLEWCIAVLAGFGIAAVLDTGPARRAPRVALVALALLAAVNAAHLAASASRYCAVDPADLVRIAVARDTGSDSLGFVMNATGTEIGNEYVFASGAAFRDNALLKSAVEKGALVPVSFWNFRGGLPVKTKRENAGFALLKSAVRRPHDDRSMMPCPSVVISILSTFAICAAGLVKASGRRRSPRA